MLSLRFLAVLPDDLIAFSGQHYIGLYTDDIEVIIPIQELSWMGTDPAKATELISNKQQVVIYGKSHETRALNGSIKRLENNPWQKIHSLLPKGTELSVGNQRNGTLYKPNTLA